MPLNQADSQDALGGGVVVGEGTVGSPAGGILTVQGAGLFGGQQPTSDIIVNAGVFGAISVTTSAVEAKVGASKLTNRKSLTVCPTNGTVYWGYSSSVTTATGTPITAGNILPFGQNISIFLIAAATTDVRITEAS